MSLISHVGDHNPPYSSLGSFSRTILAFHRFEAHQCELSRASTAVRETLRTSVAGIRHIQSLSS